MSQYEVIVILDPALTEEGVDKEIDGLREVVTKRDGQVVEVQKWGKKRLAYEVKKRREGQYVLLKASGSGDIVADLERHFRITEVVLKGTVVRAEEPKKGRFKVKSHATPGGSVVTATREAGDGEL